VIEESHLHSFDLQEQNQNTKRELSTTTEDEMPRKRKAPSVIVSPKGKQKKESTCEEAQS
jgi:hypothetical protein